VSAWIGARLTLTDAQLRTLFACGAGAGLAAVYNVPLGGAAFSLEVLLGSLALADVVPALVTAGVAAVVAWPVLGHGPIYPIHHVGVVAPVLVWAIVLAPIAGLAGVLFTRLMTAARVRAPHGWRAAVATTVVFAALGALSIAYPSLLGNGKGIAGLAFDGTLALGLAGALVLLKPLATAACLGAGAVGGLLTPALAAGAAVGSAVTLALNQLAGTDIHVSAVALTCAAGVLAITQRAPAFAALFVWELARPPYWLLIVFAVAAFACHGLRMLRERAKSAQ
jgi:H+/Cl- antiporter ClcA